MEADAAGEPVGGALAARPCVRHPERVAVAACQRCGRFVCSDDRHLLDGIVHCPECRAVDPVEAFRLRLWGRRDVWAWLMGVSAVPQAWLTVDAIRSGHGLGWTLANAATAVLCVCYFLGQRWTRLGILLTPLAVFFAPEAMFGPQELNGVELSGMVWVTKAVVLIASAGLLAGMLVNVRNKLFFRREVARAVLAQAREDYLSNRIAKWALGMALAGLVVPGLGPAALPMAVTALYRIRQHPEEILTGEREAWWAIAIGGVGSALFAVLYVWLESVNERLRRGELPF